MSPSKTTKRAFLRLFIVAWLALFVYETLRAFQLAPVAARLAGRPVDLPKLPLLFPPAGWIMFYEVGDTAGGLEVYGVSKTTATLIDPHRVFATRYVGFDNIRRGMLYAAAGRPWDFCNFLRRKFPEYPDFSVVRYQYQDLGGENPSGRLQAPLYSCRPF
ncbi:MAG: hypothetical protein HY553_18010 [Elusimicrobia bacterium]|nr:hypothetical protein [Elusimicrobiota bacterium]